MASLALRVAAAGSAPLRWADLGLVAGALAALGACGVVFRSFLVPSPPTCTASTGLALALRCFFFPCLAEEVVFRAVLLPNLRVGRVAAGGANAWGMLGEMTLQQWLWALACLALFVLYHLPSGQLLSRCGLTRDGGRTFQDPRFLALAALLGLACSGVYLASGSLWAAVAVHWLPVCLWLLFLGGEQRLRGEGYEVRPVKGAAFHVEILAEETVRALKRAIAEARADFPSELQKLLHAGKLE
ncbi:unnamed protein product [Effrenium voratum]|nr:unnamed protein product [Effrenium voratum]